MKSSTITRLFSTAAVLGALTIPAAAQGPQDVEEGLYLPGASANVTLNYVTNYFFRGIEQLDSDQGIVIQPSASVTLPVVDSVTATIGTFASIHSANDSNTSNPSALYEADIYAQLDTTYGDFTASAGLYLYSYPSQSGGAAASLNDVLEAYASVSFDDSEYLGDFAFNPYVLLAVELNNTNTSGGNGAGEEATYAEIGGAFSLNSLTEGTFAEVWDWSIPFAVGLSIDDYYTDATGDEEFVGYGSIGVVGSVPMSEYLGSDEYVGAWDLTLGLSAVIQNGEIDGQISDNGGREVQVIGMVGLSRDW